MHRVKHRTLSATRRRNAALLRSFAQHPTERKHEALWLIFQPLVQYVAARYNRQHADIHHMIDLVAAGNVGLLDALAAHRPLLEGDAAAELSRFYGLAIPLIRESISRSVTIRRQAERQAARLTQPEEKAQRLELPTRPGEVELLRAVIRNQKQTANS